MRYDILKAGVSDITGRIYPIEAIEAVRDRINNTQFLVTMQSGASPDFDLAKVCGYLDDAEIADDTVTAEYINLPYTACGATMSGLIANGVGFDIRMSGSGNLDAERRITDYVPINAFVVLHPAKQVDQSIAIVQKADTDYGDDNEQD